MQRLSKSISELKLNYDVVVIGSGYGGGVAASRMARCGRRVCVLERGREFALGEFPDRPMEAQREFQISYSDYHIGDQRGLYDLRIGNDIHVFVGCGLGGTSLVNANVALPIDARLWEDPIWPDAIIADPWLEEGEARARRMLQPNPYPGTPALPKYIALEKSGDALGQWAECPPINVTFEKRINHAGVEQSACTLCGDCCSGCNVGAKNTTQMNYLPDAVNHGADIFTSAKVNYIKKERGKWRIFFDLLGHDRDAFGTEEQSITADIIVLAAGTLGSTEILLRSRENGLTVSDRLGESFTGNGDVLAFSYNNDIPINGIGFGHPPQSDIPPVGPCISGVIDLRGSENVEDGIILEEGSIPSGLAPFLPALMAAGGITGEDTDGGFADEIAEKKRGIASLLRGAYHGAVHNTQTFLAMSHDDAGGVMKLEDNNLVVRWPGVANQPGFQKVYDKILKATQATGGTFVKNPLTSKLLGENLITVHPLGGCAIGRDRSSGVVNHKCQVFDPSSSASQQAVHQGLYVCDGSIMPRSLGVNPLLTITTLSERAMMHIAKDRGWQFDDAPRPDAPRNIAAFMARDALKPVGVEFTERMAGFISKDPNAEYSRAHSDGKGLGHDFAFTLTIRTEDVDRFATDPAHMGHIIGTVDCPTLSPEPLDVYEGTFNLMHQDLDAVETRRFDYKMILAARDGSEYRFHGYKIVRNDKGIDLWADTTTLYVDIARIENDVDHPFARGILNISPLDFQTQLHTLRGFNGATQADRLKGIAKFGALFAGSLYDIYGGIFAPTERYRSGALRKKRQLIAPEPAIHQFTTADAKDLRLTRYQGGTKGPVILAHGLGVSGQIFSLDTIDVNLVEYLCDNEYDVWVMDFRASVDLPYARELWTGDEVAEFDYPAAIAKVQAITGAKDVQMIVHCYGATTFFMAMLKNLQGVRSAVISQIATDVIVPWFPQRFLAHLRLPTIMKAFGINAVNARAETYDKLWQRVLDKLIQLTIPFQPEERSKSATSNRITALYGQLYELDQLNQATLDYGLPMTFGEANIDAFEQLAMIARITHIVDKHGEDTYLPNIKNLAIPISFIHGAENACFSPESTRLAMARLINANGPELYERHVIPEYGHIDCIFGKNAARDVFPHMVRHLDKFPA